MNSGDTKTFDHISLHSQFSSIKLFNLLFLLLNHQLGLHRQLRIFIEALAFGPWCKSIYILQFSSLIVDTSISINPSQNYIPL